MVLELLAGASFSTLALAAGSIVCAIAWWNTSNPKNLPPAPTGFPILGILPIFVSNIRAGKHVEYLISLHKKLGPILTFKAGAVRFVWVNDGALVKDMLRREEFSLRPSHLPVIRSISEGKEKGIAVSNGETNTEMRRFALLALRDFGVGKKGLDEIVQTEASVLIGQLEIYAHENGGVISDIPAKMQAATANVIHNVIFGYRNEYDDPKFKELFSKLMALTTFNPLAFPENFFPFLRYIPFLGSFLNVQPEKFLALDREAGKYMNEQIEEHRKSYCSDEIRDFIDLFIKYETEHREFYTTENIFATILDLFRAGIVTTAISLSWCTMYLARFPAIQKQVVAEIDEVIGDQVFDTKKHKAKLIKTRAFVNEMLRYVTIAGFSAPHTTLVDAEAGGYTIPAGSLVFANIFALHHDKGYWGDPEVFRIERWIDENGELLNHSDYFMPFSTGKRACPGKQLAKIEILLILIEMLQKFTFEQPLGTSDMTDEPGKGLIRAPKDFHIKIVKRT